LTAADFLSALRLHLRSRHIEHDAADLLAWCGAVRPVAQDDPDPGRWASAYAVALAEANRLAEPRPRPWRRVARHVGRRLVWLREC
jgi:hypothetical protein